LSQAERLDSFLNCMLAPSANDAKDRRIATMQTRKQRGYGDGYGGGNGSLQRNSSPTRASSVSTRGPAWPADDRPVAGLAGVADLRALIRCTASCAALAATVRAQVEHLRYEVLSDFVAALKRNVSQSQATVLSNVLAVSVTRPARSR
jgi:hypothetical protein